MRKQKRENKNVCEYSDCIPGEWNLAWSELDIYFMGNFTWNIKCSGSSDRENEKEYSSCASVDGNVWDCKCPMVII